MNKYIFLFCLVFVSSAAVASDVGMNQLPGIVEEESSLDRMKNALDLERKRKEEIKMINLEKERLAAELERQKMMQELRELKNESPKTVSSTIINSDKEEYVLPEINLKYIALSDVVKEAIISIEETSYVVAVGDKPRSDIEILDITSDKVNVELANNSQLTLKMNYLSN